MSDSDVTTGGGGGGRVPPWTAQRENRPYHPGKTRGSEKEKKKGNGKERREKRKERRKRKRPKRVRKEKKKEGKKKEGKKVGGKEESFTWNELISSGENGPMPPWQPTPFTPLVSDKILFRNLKNFWESWLILAF